MRRLLHLALVSSLLVAAGCANRAGKSLTLYESGDYAGAARAADEGLAAHPDDKNLWQMRVRAALALGDASGVEKAYAGYRATLDGDDQELLQDLANATLSQALASTSSKLKIVAIHAVASAEIQSLAEQVAERMEDQDDKVVASAAVAILRGFPQAPEVVDQMMRSDDPEARRIAVEGVGKKVGRLAIVDLMKAAEDSDARVRAAAIRWLGQLREPEAVELLLRNAKHPDEGVRAAAVIALGRIGLGNLPAVAKQALADKALPVRLAALDVMVAAKLATELAQVAMNDPDPTVAIEAAISIRSEELAAKAIERAIVAESWNVRAGTANIATRAVGKAAALAIAKRLVTDGELQVRLAAARVLAYHGDKAGASAIFAAGLEGDGAVSAATDLAKLGDQRGLDALAKAIRDEARTPDQRATVAAAHATANRVTPALVAALADKSGTVRVEAAAALVSIVK